MSYTRPPYDQAGATWQGAPAYTRPAHDAADATWQEQIIEVRASVAGPLGIAHGLVDVLALPAVEAIGRVAGPLGAPAARADLVPQARAQVAGPLGVAAARLAAVVIARASVAGPLGTPGPVARHLRYEIRGAVRREGVPLARRVRCYDLATGDLLGQADTVAGKYRVPAGLDADRLCTLIPIDLDEGAADWRPVAANRVPVVLADDSAEIAA